MDEEELLRRVFGLHTFWKEKYQIGWCELCNCLYIGCPVCHNSSCNGGGCKECHEVFEDFQNCKSQIQSYLTKEELITFEKIFFLKKLIRESVSLGDYAIDFKKFHKLELLCQREEEIFKKEIGE